MQRKLSLTFMTLLSFMIASCATHKKAALSSQETEAAFTEIENFSLQLRKDHLDLAEGEQYLKGIEHLNEAYELMNDEAKKAEIKDELAQAKYHFVKVRQDASLTKMPNLLLKARKAAIDAGALRSEKIKEKFLEIDEDLRDETDEFKNQLETLKIAKYQKRYFLIEVESVQFVQLHSFREIIKNAQENDADDLAPKTYKQAKKDIATAENMIEQTPNDPSYFDQSVLRANKSVKLLKDVMDKLLNTAKGSAEHVALKLVMQERKLGRLSDTLSMKEMELAFISGRLLDQRLKTLTVQEQAQMQNLYEAVNNRLKSEDAIVYQEGNKLVLRLKGINFAFGKAKIPTDAKKLLNTVSDVVADIAPSRVIVQGHTDSIGNFDFNKKLSQKRASSVKNFLSKRNKNISLEAKGYGENMPLVGNDSAEGREINRRVDIVIDAI